MAPLARSAAALLLLLALASGAPEAGARVVYVGSDGDWESFLEAVPEAMRYDDADRPLFAPILAVPDLSPYPVEIRTHVRQGKLAFRAEGRIVDGIPEPKELVAELRQKIVLPSLTESVVLRKAEGLEFVSAVLVRIGGGEEIPVAPDFRLDRPEGGEWQVVLRMKEGAAESGTVRLDFEVRGHDLAVVEKFLDGYRADRVVLCGKLPPAVRERLAGRYPVEEGRPFRKIAPDQPAVISMSYEAALVGAQIAALDNRVHFVYRGVEETARFVWAWGARRAIVLTDSRNVYRTDGAGSKANWLRCGIDVEVVEYPEAEADLCRRRYLGNAVVANPRDIRFPSTVSYPRSSLAAPVYAIARRTGLVFVDGGDRRRYEASRTLRNVNYGIDGYLSGYQWEDVLRTRDRIASEVRRLDLGSRPSLLLLGGGHAIPCTFFIESAFPKPEFPGVRFPEGAVTHADASVYPNLDDDPEMEACVGRLPGNTDEITAAIARTIFREEMEDREKLRANRALLVFGPWAAERGQTGEPTFAEETAAELAAAGGYDCRSFTGSSWGRDFMEHIGSARILFANDFGYHNAAFGWSSYAHKGFKGQETNYNTQLFPLDFDATYCVASSNGCATCDDKNRDNLHYGGNSLPAGLLFLRNGAMGFYGMPHAALAEITTPLTAISSGMTLGEAMRKHLNDRIANPEQGGLFGPPSGWRAEIPGYDAMPKTHPLLYPLTKQDALVLLGDPLARLDPPPSGSFLDLARGAGEFLMAGAKEEAGGLNLTGDAPAAAAYGQSTAGAAIFLARLSEVTGEMRFLDAAVRAGEFVAAATETDDDRVPGLFVGDSGKGLLFLELARITGEAKWTGRAQSIAHHFAPDWTYPKSGQPYWMTDLYMGAAGHLLFLLELSRVTEDPFVLSEARRAGDFLLRWAEPTRDGVWWSMEPWGPRKETHYIGVAHGGAGIAIALAALGAATREARYTECAEAAAKAIIDRAVGAGAGATWWAKYTPEPSQMKYQWCHGSPGMLLLFTRLFAATGMDIYREWAAKAAVTAAKPGKFYRSDMGLCHGPPGNGDVFLEAYEVFGDALYLEIARDHAEHCRRQGLVTKQGYDWWGADRSYMNGVAGVGHFFLRMACPGKYRPALIAK